MKKTNKFLSIFMFLVVAVLGGLLLVSCSCGGDEEESVKEATAYGMVHRDYIGISHVVVVNNKVVNVTFDEVFLPYNWATLPTDTTVVEADRLVIDTKTYAKYIKIGDKVFTASAYGTATTPGYNSFEAKTSASTVKYSAEDIADLYAHLAANQENAAWYVKQVQLGKVFVCNSSGTKVADANLTNGSFFKASSSYWTNPGTKLGWGQNMQLLGKAIIGTDMSTPAANVKVDGGFVKIGDTVTAATLVDAGDYYAVAKAAYNIAKAQ